MISHTSATGNSTEAAVLAGLVKSGRSVLVPFGDGQRYDLVFEESNHFYRVQCKSSRRRNGCLVFNTTSVNRITGKRLAYLDHIDYFGTYDHITGQVYLIPIGVAPIASEMSIRIDPPKSNQAKNIRWATDFVLGPVLSVEDCLVDIEEAGGSNPPRTTLG